MFILLLWNAKEQEDFLVLQINIISPISIISLTLLFNWHLSGAVEEKMIFTIGCATKLGIILSSSFFLFSIHVLFSQKGFTYDFVRANVVCVHAQSIWSKNEKIDFTPQIVIPWWTAGGVPALSEHHLWRTRYLKFVTNWQESFIYLNSEKNLLKPENTIQIHWPLSWLQLNSNLCHFKTLYCRMIVDCANTFLSQTNKPF